MRSSSRGHRASLAVLVVAALLCAPAAAQIVRFDGIDPGAAPGAPRPNSNAAAAEFEAAASELGSVQLIDAEALPLGNFASLEVAPGVTATLTGTTNASGILQGGNELYGFNTTAGGSKFFGFEPILNIETASLEFTFDEGVQAFGAYITGLGTSYGYLFAVFNDGSAQALPVTGNVSGGVLFFGFTDAGKVIASVKLELRYAISAADVFGVDDIRYVDAVTTCSDLTVSGTGAPGSTLTFDLSGGAPNAPALLMVSPHQGATTVQLGDLGGLELGLAAPILPISMGTTDPGGNATLSLGIPAEIHEAVLYAQGMTFTFEPSASVRFCTSDVETFSVGGAP